VIQDIRNLAVPAVIAVSFFLFGFFVTADLLDLSLREIVVGLVAGVVGGLTTLAAVIQQARSAPTPASAA
jgi:fluoride ion exporter CrcB/FEX